MNSAARERRRDSSRRYWQKLRNDRLARGLCVNCGKHAPEQGRQQYTDCCRALRGGQRHPAGPLPVMTSEQFNARWAAIWSNSGAYTPVSQARFLKG